MQASTNANDSVFAASLARIFLHDRDTKRLLLELLVANEWLVNIYTNPDIEVERKPSLPDLILACHEQRHDIGIRAWKTALKLPDHEIERKLSAACDIQMIEKLSIPWTRAGFPKRYFFEDSDDEEEWLERKEMLTEHDSLVPAFNDQFSSKTASVGVLNSLPSEIIQFIFSHLDFVSLAALRRVSTLAKQLVDSFPAFKNSIEHSSSTILAMREAGVLKVHSSGDYHQELTSNECTFCDDFGPFLDLYECQRICLNCRERVPSFMMNIKQAKTYSGLTKKELNSLPSVLTLNGTEHFMPTKYSYQIYSKMDRGAPRIPVVGFFEVKKLSKQKKGIEGFNAWQQERWDEYNEKWDAYQAKRATLEAHPRRGRRPEPPYAPSDLYHSRNSEADPYCWWTSTPFPYFDVRNQTHQWGRICHGCEEFDEWAQEPIKNIGYQEMKKREPWQKKTEKRRWTVHLREDIVAHFAKCKWAKRKWTKHLDELYQDDKNSD